MAMFAREMNKYDAGGSRWVTEMPLANTARFHAVCCGVEEGREIIVAGDVKQWRPYTILLGYSKESTYRFDEEMRPGKDWRGGLKKRRAR